MNPLSNIHRAAVMLPVMTSEKHLHLAGAFRYISFMYDKDRLKQHYIPRINSLDKGHEILDWESEEAHMGRFSVVIEQLDLSGRHVLDVGCGIGDFYHELTANVPGASYTGIDILPEMVEEARRRYPSGNFVSGDLFEETIFEPKSFDVIYSSGIFNLRLGDNHALLKRALPVFFALAREWVVFNLLDPEHSVQRDIYYYFDPEEAVQMVREHTSEFTLLRDYVPKDYTIFAKVPSAT